MNIHVLLLIVVLLIALLYPTHPTLRRKGNVVQIITLILTAFSGLRSWWFGDLIKYYTLYRNCNGINWKTAITENWTNMGIRVVFRMAGAVGISYEVCLFVIAAFAALSLGLLIYRYSTSPFVSYLMYICMGFYMFTFSGLKQTIAMGFLCFAMMAVLEDRPVRFVAWTIVAGFFHAPALIFLLAYPFSHKLIDRWYLLFVVAVLVLVFALRNQIVSLLSTLYQDDSDAYGTAKKIIGGRFLMMLLILAVGYYLRPVRRKDATYAKVFNVMVLAAMFQTFSVYDNVFSRLTDYFFQFVVVFMPMILRPCGGLASEIAQRESTWYYRHRDIYTIAVVAVSAYAVYYYMGYLSGSYLDNFKFLWEIDAHAIYGG
jgi:hypothetical protein